MDRETNSVWPSWLSEKGSDCTGTTSDNDYVAKTGTLTFNPGETTKTITIEVKGNGKKEANEKFYLEPVRQSACGGQFAVHQESRHRYVLAHSVHRG